MVGGGDTYPKLMMLAVGTRVLFYLIKIWYKNLENFTNLKNIYRQIYTRKMIFWEIFLLKKPGLLGYKNCAGLPFTLATGWEQLNNNWPILLQIMWKANQTHGLQYSKSFYHHHFTGSLKTARKPIWRKAHIPTNLWFTIFENPHGKIPTKVCVCVCVCVRERERENFGTKVCMYVCGRR